MNKKYAIKLFIVGMLSFTISQIVLRIPLLNIVNNNLTSLKFQMTFPLVYGFLVSISAGVFEESARFICRSKFFNNHKNIIEPIIFGIGHGIAEVIYVFISVLQTYSITNIPYLEIILYERFLAVIFHVGMTVLIWNGFLLNKRYKHLFLAILLHGLFNFLIFINAMYFQSMLILYGTWTIVILIVIAYIYKSRKIKGGEIYEEV